MTEEPTEVPWPHYVVAPIAQLACEWSEITERTEIVFGNHFDGLDDCRAAVVRLPSGVEVVLLRHRGNPTPGVQLHGDNHRDFEAQIQEVLGLFGEPVPEVTWRGEPLPW